MKLKKNDLRKTSSSDLISEQFFSYENEEEEKEE